MKNLLPTPVVLFRGGGVFFVGSGAVPAFDGGCELFFKPTAGLGHRLGQLG
jgi:hypothetical protein